MTFTSGPMADIRNDVYIQLGDVLLRNKQYGAGCEGTFCTECMVRVAF